MHGLAIVNKPQRVTLENVVRLHEDGDQGHVLTSSN